jgi:hypothetical protein
MALILIATAGADDANAYADADAGDVYHEAHLYASSWEDASEDEKNRALVTATRMLDTWWDWIGEVATEEQALRWPRLGAYDPDGRLLTDTEIPVAIANGTIELARSLLAANREADFDIETQGLESVKAGPVDLKFRADAHAKPIPDAVQSMLSHYGRMRPRGGSDNVTLYRA